jgi:hypothetical protein
MRIVFEGHFDSVQDFFIYQRDKPALGLGNYPVCQMFRAKRGRVFIRVLLAKHHCLGR